MLPNETETVLVGVLMEVKIICYGQEKSIAVDPDKPLYSQAKFVIEELMRSVFPQSDPSDVFVRDVTGVIFDAPMLNEWPVKKLTGFRFFISPRGM